VRDFSHSLTKEVGKMEDFLDTSPRLTERHMDVRN